MPPFDETAGPLALALETISRQASENQCSVLIRADTSIALLSRTMGATNRIVRGFCYRTVTSLVYTGYAARRFVRSYFNLWVRLEGLD